MSYLGGFTASSLIASPAEWMVHRYMLHPKTRNILNTHSGISHNDRHHGAYSGPEHYYRDMSNAHEKIHFGKKWVMLIHALSAGIGLGASELAGMVSSDYKEHNSSFVAGFLTGTAVYYGAYEILHHHMHVIGRRRYAINSVFGNQLEEHPEGHLRFSKPTLDDLCNHVEMRIDAKKDTRDAELLHLLEHEREYNLTETHDQRAKGKVTLKNIDIEDAVEESVSTLRAQEQDYRSSLGVFGRVKYAATRFLLGQMRLSPAFQYMDNHHFVHHFQYYKNLNIVFPLADAIMGTRVDCSKKRLREQKAYWICPNSPNVTPFKLEKELAAQQEMLAGQLR